MASFDEHILKAKSNLTFLAETNHNSKTKDFWDWQVTSAFYIAVHVINAHLAKQANLHYKTHEQVKNAISLHNSTAPCPIPDEIYLCYAKLEGYSKRSRYLCHQDPTQSDNISHPTIDKHFARAIKKLDKILEYFAALYHIDFGKHKISCPELKKTAVLSFFGIVE